MASDNENGVELVRRGYNEPTRCLDFRVSFSTYGDGRACVLAALRAIGGYNNFDPELVAMALDPFLAHDVVRRVDVGREGSPVIYLRTDAVPEFRHVIENALRDVRADELDWTGDTLRAWWD